MKTIKKLLKKIDVFGVPYSFKYKKKERYTTALSGLFVLLFLFVALCLAIYYFIPFYNRKNYTTVFYTLTMSHTERISFSQSETAFAIGFNCWTGKDGTKADQLFTLDYKYIYYNSVDKSKKNSEDINTHPCTKEDFYNKYNETFDGSKIYNYQCLDDPSRAIEGIYTSPTFAYYEFDVYAKNNSEVLLDKINSYLLESDCKLQIYYSDNTVDIDNYEDPIKSYIEAVFIQINPTLSTKRNLYFMNQYLYDDDFLLGVFGEDDGPKYTKTLFSRYEEYSLYQGLNRTNISSDYLNYAKVYLRADTKRTDVKRRYQKFMEFYADNSSILLAIFYILAFIFTFINSFWAEQDLSKKIFFFKDLQESDFNIKRRTTQILELIDITGIYSNQMIITLKSGLNEKNINYNDNTGRFSRKNSENTNVLRNNETNISNNKRYRNISFNKINKKKERDINIIRIGKANLKNKYQKDKNNTTLKRKNEISQITGNNEFEIGKDKEEYYFNNHEHIKNKIREKESRIKKNFKYNLNLKNISKYKDNYNIESEEYNASQFETGRNVESTERQNNNNNTLNVDYNFNICEVIFSILFKCCLSRNLRIKNNLNEKAKSFLYNKLDINLYVRNMILFDILNETVLGNDAVDIINFLSHPIISLKEEEKNEFPGFYHRYKTNDFDKFYGEIVKLSQKPKKSKEKIELISLTNKHLKMLLA